MSIRVVCPSCSSEYTVPDELRGKKGRCRSCQGSFIIGENAPPPPPERPARAEDADSPAPRRPRRERWEEEEEDPRPRRKARPAPRRSGVLVPLVIVGGAIITILAAVGAGLGVWMYAKSRAPAETAGGNSSTSSPNGGGQTGAATESIRSFWSAALPPFQGGVAAGGSDLELGAPPSEESADVEPGGTGAAPRKPRETPAADVSGQLVGDVLQKVKRATFYLRVSMANGQTGSGSGFLFDDSGVVVTNAHVLGMLEASGQKPKLVEVFVNSGERDERKVTAEVLGVDRGNDLGLLRIPRKGLPEPLAVKSAEDLFETQPLWVSGFPLGEQLGKNVTVTACPVSSLRKEHGVLTRVQVHGDMQPGNSGGPVVDARGDVVGVAVAIIRQTRINFAIPGDAVLNLVNGRLAHLSLGVPFTETESARLPVKLEMHDPLRKIRKLGVELWVGEPGRERPASSSAPPARATDGPRTRLDLSYQPATGRAEGTLTLPELPAGKVYWVQPLFEDGRGLTRWASGTTFQASPPVTRKPIHLALKPTGQARKLTLQQDSTLRLRYTINQLFEVGVKFQTTWSESQHESTAAGAAEVRRQYTDFALSAQYNRGKPIDSPLQSQLGPVLGKLSAKFRLDPELRLHQEEFGPDLPTANSNLRSQLQALHALTQQKLDLVAVPLPGKLVQPGEQWKPAASRTLLVDTFERIHAGPAALPWTFTYVGVRTEAGRELAAVALDTHSTEENAAAQANAGSGSGLAFFDAATGQLVRLEARYHLDFTGHVSGIPIPARASTELRIEEK